MPFDLPVCCPPDAFDMLHRQLPRLHRHRGLLEASLAVSKLVEHDQPPKSARRNLQELAERVQMRVQGDQPQAMLAHLHDVLFDEEGFSGNQDDFYHPDNSSLPVVLESRRGLPITLALIYCQVARRVGLRAWGVGLPGHFIVAIQADGNPMLVDVFNRGRVIDIDEAHDLIRRRHGADVPFDDQMLRPFAHEHWLSRMLQNLLGSYSSRGDYSKVAAVLEMQLLLWPQEARLQRDLALVLARIGKTEQAHDWLHRYLTENPDDPQRDDLRQLLDALTA